MEARIRELEAMLERRRDRRGRLDDGTVAAGSVVTIRYEGDDDDESYLIGLDRGDATTASRSSRPARRSARPCSGPRPATWSRPRPPAAPSRSRSSRSRGLTSPDRRRADRLPPAAAARPRSSCPGGAPRSSATCRAGPAPAPRPCPPPRLDGDRRPQLVPGLRAPGRRTSGWWPSTTGATAGASAPSGASAWRTAPTTPSRWPTRSASTASSRSATRWAARSPSSSGTATPTGSTAWCCAPPPATSGAAGPPSAGSPPSGAMAAAARVVPRDGRSDGPPAG